MPWTYRPFLLFLAIWMLWPFKVSWQVLLRADWAYVVEKPFGCASMAVLAAFSSGVCLLVAHSFWSGRRKSA